MATKPKFKMSRAQRAAQFAPFDALSGFSESIGTEGYFHTRVERFLLSEEEAFMINRKLCQLKKGKAVSLTYYDNGHYHVINGNLEKIDETYRYLVINRIRIGFDDIYDISLDDIGYEDFKTNCY